MKKPKANCLKNQRSRKKLALTDSPTNPKQNQKKPRFKVEISAGGVVFKKLKSKNALPAGRQEKVKILILLIKDSFGRWALPKGHIEKKESVAQAAAREISEETGLKKIKIVKKLGQNKFFFRWKNRLVLKIVYNFLFQANCQEKTRAQTKEITGLKWVNAAQAKKIVTYKNLKPVLEKAIKYLAIDNS